MNARGAHVVPGAVVGNHCVIQTLSHWLWMLRTAQSNLLHEGEHLSIDLFEMKTENQELIS